MSRRLSAQGCTQVHRRDLSNNPTACGPCGQPSHLTTNTGAPLHPHYAHWPNQIERWFGLITQPAIRRGSLRRVGELLPKIDAYVARYNLHRRPLVGTASADSIPSVSLLMGHNTSCF